MRYQNGTIEEVGGIWYIRFTVDGKRPRFRIGLKSQFKTESAASRAAQHIRDQINSPSQPSKSRTFGEVIARYENEEMPARYSTRRGYMQIHRLYLLPKWGNMPLTEMNTMEVRAWILNLKFSTRTRGHIHGQMRVLWRFAMLWGWTPAAVNPMSLFSVPGATKRTRQPRTISPQQFLMLIKNESDIIIRAMYFGAYCLGLRASELFALQWHDFDFLGGWVHIDRAIVDGRVDDVKTERSREHLPLPKRALDAFLALYGKTEYKGQGDWVFASPAQMGQMPFNSQHIQFNMLRVAGKAIGLDFSLGWHTFRHSFKNLLKASGSDPEMMRDLMRHSDTHTTMNVYGESDFERMRAASDKAMDLIFKEE
jgi:integrase